MTASTAHTALGLDRMSDAELLRAACQLLSIPRSGEANSFTLHAPLELMARAQLLPLVSGRWRETARQRIAHIAATWSATGGPFETRDDTAHAAQPLHALTEAVRHGDRETADRSFVFLCARRDQDQIVADLVDVVLPQLGGAAHGAIFLELLPRFRPAGVNPALMARTLLRDIAHHPDWRLGWFDEPRPERAHGVSLTDRLVSPRADGEPSSHFVQPTMALVEDTGLNYRTLADVTEGLSIDEARRQLLPIAAMSMLQDAPTNAPYGWTHCPTLPQATLAVAHRASDAQRAVDVAASPRVPGNPELRSDRSELGTGPTASIRRRGDVLGPVHSRGDRLACNATPTSRHHPAARRPRRFPPRRTPRQVHARCLDAATQDPSNAHLYLAAAAYLAAWWQQHDDADGAVT